MKELSLKEVHTILLEIAKEFHAICQQENIPYYMLGGTMLGTVREKGFIPWDDDMDFGVPIENYEQLKRALIERLPPEYKCTTHHNDIGNKCPFIKVADKRTRIDDPTSKLPLLSQLGVNIDIFPLVKCSANSKRVNLLFKLCRLYTIVFTYSSKGNHVKNALKSLFSFIFPINRKKTLDMIYAMLVRSHDENGAYIGNLFGAWGKREIVEEAVMGKPILYQFEDTYLYGVEKSDIYLRSLYGDDYMIPPKESERHIHAARIFKL